jgi:purine-cytosine permease-like protein
MVQFYFLSIVLNITAGFVLSYDFLEERMERLAEVKSSFSNKTFRFVLGIAALVVGFLKLLSVFKGDILVVGDLLPAAAGLLMGIMLIIDYYKTKAEVASQAVDAIDRVFNRRKSIIGIIGMVIGVLHFFMPSVLFL